MNIYQGITADATANATQDSNINQGSDATDPGAGTAPAETPPAATPGTDSGSMLDGDLLNIDVDLAADVDLSAPINGAIAANANVAAPIDAAVAANVGSVNSDAVAIADQDAVISQHIDGAAEANSDQQSTITQ